MYGLSFHLALMLVHIFFCKITRAVINYLRDLGLRAASFVDDGCLAVQRCDIDNQKSLLFYTLDNLGFFVNALL